MKKDVDYIIDQLIQKYLKKFKLPKEELIQDLKEEGLGVEDMDTFVMAFEKELKATKKINSEIKFAKTTQYFGLVFFIVAVSIVLVTYIYAKLKGWYVLKYGVIVFAITIFFQNRTKVQEGKKALEELKNNRISYWK
ncbi:MAG: hypothetical protein N4A35_04380 [Flavobacteriales bacterium]|jgi:hypothetical protein|nr:hypothetical protein [Flavobacteriales bacterium]